MVEKPYQNREWLYEKYVEEQLTGAEIADAAGCARTTVYDWLDRHEIDRERGEGYRVSSPEKYRDKEWLEEKYHEERLSTSEIGELCDCHKQTIKLWLEKHDIEKRSRSEAAKVRMENNPELAESLIESGKENLKKHGTSPKEAMSEEEFEEFCQRLSKERTGEGNPMYGVTGRDNPCWKENKPQSQFYQSKEWKGTRKEVLERDDHKCQSCGATRSESRDTLDVHHIIPIAAGGGVFDVENLVSLCQKCHRKWEGLYLRPDTR